LVARGGRGAGDRRRVGVALTEAGRARAAALIPQAQAHEARLLEGLAPQEASALRTALKALIARQGGGEETPVDAEPGGA
ncbi:MAG: hypothetical protein AAF763_18105, partial [Pseudomonadota bacterium]